jgi:NADH-quinone oxidoreductase subunit C/D
VPALEQTSIWPELFHKFDRATLTRQETQDGIPTVWASPAQVRDVLGFLKNDAVRPYRMLYDLSAVDERLRQHRTGQPASDFSLVYHLASFERNEELRLKIPLTGVNPSSLSVSDLWPNADWYEREIWDMFGIGFTGRPHLRRLLMPATWKGHPLRKEHPARATEMGLFELPESKQDTEQEALEFRPEE